MNTIRTWLAHASWKELIYPGVLLLYALIVVVLLVAATGDITVQLNRVFTAGNAADTMTIDTADYTVVAHRFGLPITDPAASGVVPLATQSAATTSAPETPQALDKSAVSIAVYNATTIAGLAAKLKAALVAQGFTVQKTGNAAAQTKNTIEIKESKKAYAPLIQAALGAAFASAEIQTLPDSAHYDCEITLAQP